MHTDPQNKHRHTSTIKVPHLSLPEASSILSAVGGNIGRNTAAQKEKGKNDFLVIFYTADQNPKLHITHNSIYSMFLIY